MALVKRTYVDGETIITAQNLNDIQDEIISQANTFVPKTRTINSKALDANITLTASDLGAVPTTRTVNSKALSSNITLTAADVSAVPTTRTVNSKALSSNITLTSGDIGYSSSTTYTSGTIGAAVSDLNGALNSTQTGIAPVLTQFKAPTTLAQGVMRIYDGQLYKTTQVVQSGDDLIIGTNVKITDVNTEFARGDARNITRVGNYQELADFYGTSQTTIQLTEDAQHYTMISMQLFNSNNEMVATNYMPTIYYHNLNIKLYGEGSSQWGSFQLSNDYLSGTFNRTSANTSHIKIIGFFNTVN